MPGSRKYERRSQKLKNVIYDEIRRIIIQETKTEKVAVRGKVYIASPQAAQELELELRDQVPWGILNIPPEKLPNDDDSTDDIFDVSEICIFDTSFGSIFGACE